MESSLLDSAAITPALYKLLHHFADAPSVLAFNSNRQQTDMPEAYHTFDWMLAVSYEQGNTWHEACFQQLETCLRQDPSHWVGYLTYDLKNELERLQSSNSDEVDFAPAWFFKPQLLVQCVHGQIRVLHHEGALAAALTTALAGELPNIVSLPKLTFERSTSDAHYLQTVEHIRKLIAAGTVYELNYCMEWYTQHQMLNVWQTYRQLNEKTRAPFSVYLRQNDKYLLSASPERFLRHQAGRLLSQPIKGTRPRSADAAVDAQLRSALAADEKERAENVMIVDLVRNDLSRSCQVGTVLVPALMQVYSFATVHQMISTVSGQLRSGMHPLQALQHAFPMGSMTGAPKIKAMEIIDKLEDRKRGLYSGAVGYFTPQGDYDFNVVIRSLQYRADTGYLSLMTGSAITYDSDPQLELEECQLKAAALLGLFA